MTKKKIALITGGSRGLGKDIALSLAARGVDVIITYNTAKQEADGVVAEISKTDSKAVALQFDISKSANIDGFLDQVKDALRGNWTTDKLDYLINNAGIGASAPIAEITEEFFDTFLNIHFKGVFFLTQKALAMMNDNGGVVFVTAAGTRFVIPGYSVYSSFKSAVETFTRYVAKEYGPRGIRSNIVAPGGIDTDFNGALIRNSPQLQSYVVAQTALGRVGHANDIGGVVAFLCSDDARWINGQRIEVTGGIHL